jgi:integrase
MTDEKPDKKKRDRRDVGQRTTLIASKKYRIRVYLGKDSAGRRRYHNETVHGSAEDANERIREVLRRHKSGEAIKPSADTFSAFLDEWLASKRLSVAESSLESYRFKVDHSIRPALGDRLLVAITAADIEAFYADMVKAKVSRSYLGDCHVVLSMVFKLAVRRKKLIGSPLVAVEPPKNQSREADGVDRRAMTAEEVDKFLAAAAGTRFENLYRVAFNVGFRPSEMLALKWDDFDEQAKTLRVDQNLVWRTSTERKANPKLAPWYLKTPKSQAGRRTLPITPAVVAVLKAQRRAQNEARLKAGKLWTNHGFIFADATGDPWPANLLRADFKKTLKAAGLPLHLSPKSARHTVGSLLMSSGVSPKAVQQRLGHEQITTTLKHYSHVMPGEQEQVSELMEALLNVKK